MQSQSDPPEQPQRKVSLWAKYIFTLIFLGFVSASTLLGVVLAPHITVLGIVLNVRAILQYIFANLNNRRMIRETGKAIVEGIILYRGKRLSDDDKSYLKKLIGKKLTLDEFTGAIEARLNIQPHLREKFWKKVANASIAALRDNGYNVEMVIDANVPIYRVTVQELTEVLNGLVAQILPFRVIWLVLNDPENNELREFLHRWIYDRQVEVWAEFDASNGQMTEEYRDFLLSRWQLIDLNEADKRSAMTAAWLSSFGVAVDQLEEFVKQLFENPEQQLALKPPDCQINLNVDSDTIASPFASWITYLSFVIFGLAGLTSNVRISNISNKLDPELSWKDGFVKWFISWSNYFKYDFANGVERAAQSWFWCVVCMSGPWMAVLTSTIPSFLGRFVNYTLRGVRIKPGDDRKVTYELNRRRMRVAYHPWVVTFTDAPDNIARYCSIQDRWTMSMYANFLTSLIEGQIWKLHPWSILDQFYAAGFTFLVMGVFTRMFAQAFYVSATSTLGEGLMTLVPYAIIFVLVNLIRGLYAVWDNGGDWRGMLNSFYVILVIRYLIPIKINRLFIKGITPKTYRWAGR